MCVRAPKHTQTFFKLSFSVTECDLKVSGKTISYNYTAVLL